MNPNFPNQYDFKVVILGEGATGKTSIFFRYIDDSFQDAHRSTVQASFLTKRLIIDNKKVNVSIWDTAGQEKFHALGPLYYRNAHGAVLVYDISSVASFDRVKLWVKELQQQLGPNVPLVIAGNKVDQESSRVVPDSDAESYAMSVGLKHHPTSAKLNTGITQMFYELVLAMVDKMDEEAKKTTPPSRGLVLCDDEATPSGCCSGIRQRQK